MKELLSIEEKAKAYDEAIERARKIKNGEPIDVPDGTPIPVAIFQELIESDDEKMRAMAIKAVHAPEAQSCIKSWGVNPEDVIAWLEKQGEQKDILEDATLDNNEDGLIADTINAKCEQKSVKWSDEDYVMQRAALEILIASPKTVASTILKESVIVWLQSLKDRVQPKQEWSDEDKKMMRNIISDIQCGTSFNHEVKQEANRREAWFKDLCSRLQWKPSDEQLDSLYDVLNPCDGFNREVLESLYVQLKKLREE